MYHSLVLQGKLRTAVRWITKQDTGGVLMPEDYCTKTEDRVMEVLHTKHPKARPPSATSLDTYTGRQPELVLVDITYDTVMEVAGCLFGGAGPGEADLVSLQHWHLRFGLERGGLRLTVMEFEEWLANGRPPWAAYRSLMSGIMIALDKHPGVRPVRVGETCRCLMSKCIQRVTGKKAKAACGTDKLAGGMNARIKRRVYDMRLLWAHHSWEEYWGFIIIGARNVFNEENLEDML